MSNNEAKFVLGAYRPNGQDAGDAVFSAALKRTQEDPALGVWFAREQAHAAAVAAKVAEIAPPPGLRDAIVAGMQAGRSKRAGWRRTTWFALAAAAAIAVTLTMALPAIRAKAAERQLAKFVLADLANERAHHSGGDAAHTLQTLLSRPTTHLASDLTVDFATLRATGCRTLSFGGKAVIEVCFQRNGRWFHLYAIRDRDLPELRGRAGPVITARDGYACASWTDTAEGCRFVVGTAGDASAVAALL